MINWEYFAFFVIFCVILFVAVAVNWKKIEPIFKKLSDQNKQQIEQVTGKRAELTKRLILKIIVIFSIIFVVLVMVTGNLESKERILILGPVLIPVVVGVYKYLFGKLPS